MTRNAPFSTFCLALCLLACAFTAHAKVLYYANFQSGTPRHWTHWSDKTATQAVLPEPGNPQNYVLLGKLPSRCNFVHQLPGLDFPACAATLSFKYFIPRSSHIDRLEVNYRLHGSDHLYVTSHNVVKGRWTTLQLPFTRALPYARRPFTDARVKEFEIGCWGGSGQLWLDDVLVSLDETRLARQARPRFLWKPGEPFYKPSPGSTAYFVKTFASPPPGSLANAWLQLSAAGEATAWLNGHLLGKAAAPPSSAEFPLLAALHPGTNVLCIALKAPSSDPVGLAAVLGLQPRSGPWRLIASASTWRVSSTPPSGWPRLQQAPPGLAPAVEVASPGHWPWELVRLWPLKAPWPWYELPAVAFDQLDRTRKLGLVVLSNRTAAPLSGFCTLRFERLSPDLRASAVRCRTVPYTLVPAGSVGLPLPELADYSGPCRLTVTLSTTDPAQPASQPGVTRTVSRILYLAVPPAKQKARRFRFNSKATGFFHLEKAGERTWLLDPDGHPFFSLGVNAVWYADAYCSACHNHLLTHYASPADWRNFTADRLRWLNFNTLGWGVNEKEAAARGLAFGVYVGCTYLGPRALDASGRPALFPDVFDPRWQAAVQAKAESLAAKYADNPYLLGYYMDNEVDFSENLVNYVWSPASTRRLSAFLKERYSGDLARFNAAWKDAGVTFASFDDLPKAAKRLQDPSGRIREDLLAFVRLAVKTYADTTTAAFHSADPHHLVFSPRFSFVLPAFCADYFAPYDIIALNLYPRDYWGQTAFSPKLLGFLEAAHKATGRPVLVTEWGGFALDTPFANAWGTLATQQDRALQYRTCLDQLFAIPWLVGAHYFAWYDSTDSELKNWGLVSPRETFYSPLVSVVRKTNAELLDAVRNWRPPKNSP